MDKRSRAILARFPGRKKGSQLAPHRDLICKLHQRGYTLGEIVHILSDNFNLTIVPSTVFRFIARQEQEALKPRKIKPGKEKPVHIMQATPGKITSALDKPSNEIRQKIAMLKQQQPQPEPDAKRFDYAPDQPLHLVREDGKA